MSMGFRYSLPKTMGELAKAGGSLHRMTDRCARRDAAVHPPSALAGFLRDHADHPWKPPVGGIAAALGHDVLHGLDITVALGIDRRVPEDRIRILLDTVTPEPSGSSRATSAASNSAPPTSTGPTAPAPRCPAPHRTSCCWPTDENFPRATSRAS